MSINPIFDTDVTADLGCHLEDNMVPNQDFGESLSRLEPFFVRKMPLWKRFMDIAGALMGLILSFPIFLLVSMIIKTVSPGPVFFKQQRVGYGGKKFMLLKFRTMNVDTDTSAHQQYLSDLISGHAEYEASDKPMTKLDDGNSQIILGGKILRNTYLDELPQLVNVLRGEMSLVGPRPPIPYEVVEYGLWHIGRFDSWPGMTGLWQVSGKNRLTFREMVRLDIYYGRNLSILTDLKILLMTPLIIISELMSVLIRERLKWKGTKENG
jgi:lipopolysaccharide/colanic/teichoic acid biosynthesis glycosyltransferase